MRKILATVVALTSILVAVPAVTGAAPSTSQVYVTHGLPLDKAGTKVDVYVNGARLIDDFTFGKTAGPLTLPAAKYNVEIRTPDGATALIKKAVTVPGGGNFSVVASFVDAAGTPGLNVFANRTLPLPANRARVALHHAAAAPPVDVYLGRFPSARTNPFLRRKVAAAAPNGAQANLWLRSTKKYLVDVELPRGPRVLSLDALQFPSRSMTNVYVVGSAAGGTLQVITANVKL